jgi:hypothetical protein
MLKTAHAELIFHTYLSTPIAVRDMVIHSYASDCLLEHGCIAFMGKSIDSYEEIPIPAAPSIFYGYRANIKKLNGIVNVISPTMASVIIYCLISL